MDGPITRTRGKRFQEELGERLNSLMEEKKKKQRTIFIFNCILDLFSDL